MDEPRNPALEAQIFEQPDEESPYLVYGDWLETLGHPRGKLIAAQAAGRTDAETEILAEHRAALVGPQLDIEPTPVLGWRWGFWHRLSIGSFGHSPKPVADDQVAQLLAHPSARFVRELAVRGALTPAVFATIARAHRTLVALDASIEDGVGDGGLEQLRDCLRLESLHLFSCENVTERGMAALRALTELRSIDLRNCPLDDRKVECLADLPRLERVMFNAVDPSLSPRAISQLARLPLTSLELDGESLVDDHVAPLAGHVTLANLEIGGAPLSPRGASSLGTLPNLRRLYLPSSSLGDRGVHALAGLPLRSLHLGHCRTLTDDACVAIGRMSRLAFLGICSNQITAAGLRALQPLHELEQLDLAFLDLDDAAVEELRAFPRLRTLSLAFSQITDAALDALIGLPLESLDLAGSRVTAAGIDRLATMPNLVALGLEECAPETRDRARACSQWYVSTRDLLEQHDTVGDYE